MSNCWRFLSISDSVHLQAVCFEPCSLCSDGKTVVQSEWFGYLMMMEKYSFLWQSIREELEFEHLPACPLVDTPFLPPPILLSPRRSRNKGTTRSLNLLENLRIPPSHTLPTTLNPSLLHLNSSADRKSTSSSSRLRFYTSFLFFLVTFIWITPDPVSAQCHKETRSSGLSDAIDPCLKLKALHSIIPD